MGPGRRDRTAQPSAAAETRRRKVTRRRFFSRRRGWGNSTISSRSLTSLRQFTVGFGQRKMLITERGIVPNICSYLFQKKNGRKSGPTTVLAQRRDLGEKSRKQERPIFPSRFSNTILVQSAVAVLGLGFIDAGYSGDWSRIGVISKETEDLLKLAAFVVVPLCILLILYLSEKHEA